MRRLNVKILRRALLLAACVTAVFASVGATSASATYCGGIKFLGNYYVGGYRAAGVEIIESPNDAGFGSIRRYQKRWRDRQAYRTCYGPLPPTPKTVNVYFHRHYRYYGEDTRSQFCATWNNWPYYCADWTSPTWRSVTPGLIFMYSHRL